MKYCPICYAAGYIVVGRDVLRKTDDGIPVVILRTKKCQLCKGEGFVPKEKN